MAPTRKTEYVANIVAKANKMIESHKTNHPDDKDVRRGIANLLESILDEANAYAGYRFLSSEIDSETGYTKPGYDNSAREYIIHRALS